MNLMRFVLYIFLKLSPIIFKIEFESNSLEQISKHSSQIIVIWFIFKPESFAVIHIG